MPSPDTVGSSEHSKSKFRKDQSTGETIRRNIGRLWNSKPHIPKTEFRPIQQQVEKAASEQAEAGTKKFPVTGAIAINRISRVLSTWKNKKVSETGGRMLNQSYHNHSAFWNQAKAKFDLPQTPQPKLLTAIQYALASDLQKRKIWHQPIDTVSRIVSGIDGKIWIHGVEKDSLTGEGHQDQYHPLGGPAEGELKKKVAALAGLVKAKEKRTRAQLKHMLNKYSHLFMTKGMAIEGTVKTQHRIQLKKDFRVQHYPPQRLGTKQRETQEEEVRKLFTMGP